MGHNLPDEDITHLNIADKKNAPLEQKQRLSRSMLWALMRSYYRTRGVEAWRSDGVPHLLTSSPFLAEAYANIVLGFLRDCQASGQINSNHPVYILELGAGHGRFGYAFLKKLLGPTPVPCLSRSNICYVMTDFSEKNLNEIEQHDWLRPLLESGILDVAQFDVVNDDHLELNCSKRKLRPGTVVNPVVVIANYVFDSIPQDVFLIEEGQLYESLVTTRSNQKETDLNDPSLLSRVEISFQHSLAPEQYYENPEWNHILEGYRLRLPGAGFVFPTAALSCIERLLEISGGRLLLLSGDKGYCRDVDILRGVSTPAVALHAQGCFSMMVDYQIIGQFFLSRGGLALHPTATSYWLNISAFIAAGLSEDYAETRRAYTLAVDGFSPEHVFTLEQAVADLTGNFKFEQIMALLRLSCWGSRTLWECLPALKSQAAQLSEHQKQELQEALERIWETYLPIGEELDLAFNLGTLLLEAQCHLAALAYFEHSLRLYGAEPGTCYNMALCYFGIGQLSLALDYVDQALEMDRELDAAKALRITLESKLNADVTQLHPFVKSAT